MLTFLRQVPRNAALLVFLLALIVMSPIIPANASGYLIELMFDGVLIAGVYSVGPGKHRWPFFVLTVATLSVRWGEQLSGVSQLDLGALFITVVWLVYADSIIIAHLFNRRDVTVDTILGAMVAYLLVAVAFTLVFEIIEIQKPGSFSGIADGAALDRSELTS